MSHQPHLSVVLPAHNEAASIAAIVQRTRATVGEDAQILVVDDGSNDGTAERARDAGAEVMQLRPNRGKGVAIRRGLERVRGEVVVLLDADGQDHPEEIPTLLAALTGDVGLVIGSRFIGRFDPGAITRLNHLGSLALRAVLNRLWGLQVSDPFAGFRAFRVAALEGSELSARRYDIEIDMLLALVERGIPVVDVPVRRSPRAHGSTGLSPFGDGARMLRMMVRRRVRALTPG